MDIAMAKFARPLACVFLLWSLSGATVSLQVHAERADSGGLRRSRESERKHVTSVGSGKQHAMLESFPTGPHDPSLLRQSLSTTIPVDGDSTMDVTIDDNHRRTVSSSTELRIENDCGDNLYFLIWYERDSRPWYGLEGAFMLNRGQSRSFTMVTNPVFFLYAEISGKVYWHDNSSGKCWMGMYCGREYDVGTTDPDITTFTFLCPGQFDATPSPTPAPTPLPTPYPIAQPTPSPTPGPIIQLAPPMSSLDAKWLEAHNDRRRTHHLDNGVAYVPLIWNQDVAASAQSYAELLLSGFSDCQIAHGFQGDSYGGENLYMTYAQSSSIAAGSWVPNPPSPDAVLTGWYDNEQGLSPWSRQLHLTQVVWRGTEYFGCGQAEKNYGANNDGWCSIHVCRYIAPGNCNVNENNFLDKVLDEYSPCGPHTP